MLIRMTLVPALFLAACCAQTPAQTRTTLSDLIKEQQRNNVRESYGVWAQECFTWIDLKEFTSEHKPARIADGLKHTQDFVNVVLIIKAMPQDRQQALLKAARRPLRPTWAEIGEISRKGQTDAGQEAERLIANAIVDSVADLIRLPALEIQRLLH